LVGMFSTVLQVKDSIDLPDAMRSYYKQVAGPLL
jgi:hypothetical protein